MSGYDYRRYYLDYEKKKSDIINKHSEKIKKLLNENQLQWFIDEKTSKPVRNTLEEEEKIDEDYQDELDDLEEQYQLVSYC